MSNELRQRKMEKESETVDSAPEEAPLPHLREIGMADFVTMCNAVCGTASIFLCLNYLENDYYEKYLRLSFILLPVGLFCDLIDGYIARKRYSSPFGGDLDSLADLISFGVAPACLGFTLGLRGIWDSAILIVFVLCGLSRLARYNVTADLISNELGKVPYYEGLPIPSSLILVFILFLVYMDDSIGNDKIWGGKMEVYPGHFHPFSLLYLIEGLLMISQVKIPKL
mmetsp:Transcript_16667/g.18875  ORF Transcript_16667/g.18875 Transcript_16667/m.18875 type:complete len:226 (-) Transcript_16667:897-1574(-)|eukprot:CAMPEP_0184019340 /NCGR_PEP_ID=MMETSP0954-20121128/8693_1 /TAXON_ID=627963 /ORGANISM="Aplanochytrium sp, Strain PBS07" /LENGTH=225 /DNA_ID=CAMNT_0026300987 /DNA_START=186 /DNA_END=863 /DNA_ORIENTATION=-